MSANSLTLSFDIGYASIGWCVLASPPERGADPGFLGTGVVTFPTDDCLASTRRDLRRTRRHIRSTRQRIERMKLWLIHRGVLSREDLDRPGHPAPFLLAAATLQKHKTLSAWELWTVLRWYAHNRGYDGNSLWSRDEANDDDTEKETNAKSIMAKYGTKTMAETVCACLGLKPAEHATRISSALPYKTLNAAYPRDTVFAEVSTLLSKHIGQIPGLDGETVRFLIKAAGPEILTKEEKETLAAAKITLPRRYHGGLLFGQLVPRFDNRIISRCPITWAKSYDEAIGEGKTDPEARKLSEKFAKVPAAKSKEFLEYRFARILANIKADNDSLPKSVREQIWLLAEKRGVLTSGDLKKVIASEMGDVSTNLEAYFNIHPKSAEALVFNPALAEVTKSNGKRARLSPIWKHLPESTRLHALETWSRGGNVSFASLLDHAGNPAKVVEILEKEFPVANKPKKGKTRFTDFNDYLLNTRVSAAYPSGRAPYARPILRQVVEEVRAGHDPTRANRTTDPKGGEDKPKNGVLYDLGIPTSRVRMLQAERPMDHLTNNHLVRHRMLILDRLVDDLVTEFTTQGNQITQVIVEVARELKEFSGMSAKEISMELNSRLKDFKTAVAYLEKHAPKLDLTASIIRKCRIAMDLGWMCPFTGEKYDAYDLTKLEREHIIPYATRNTNALNALVLTFSEVNRMKGKRTARQFIIDEGGKTVPGNERLSLLTLRNYDALVEKLDTKGHDDDRRRKKARKALLATTDFEDKELGFTAGALTQSSQLMKLAMGALKQKIPAALIDPIPGPVTAEIRKSWRLTGTLALACPEVVGKDGEILQKNEIRGLTHLHHALDAATLALAAHYFPLRKNGQNQSGKIWQALMKRRRTQEEKDFLHSLGIFGTFQRPTHDGQGTETDVRLLDLPKPVKEALAHSLAQCRVMQHVPADQSGAKAELTTWGVTGIEGEGDDARIGLQQNSSIVENERRKKTLKTREERAGKLLGPNPKNGIGKLAAIKGAMIIGENYGLALDPAPTVIPFHNVPARLAELRQANGGKPIRVLRNGMLIRLKTSPAKSRQDYTGVWRVTSIKNNKGNYLLNMIRPSYVTAQNGVEWSGMNKSLEPLLACGLEILPKNYSAKLD